MRGKPPGVAEYGTQRQRVGRDRRCVPAQMHRGAATRPDDEQLGDVRGDRGFPTLKIFEKFWPRCLPPPRRYMATMAYVNR